MRRCWRILPMLNALTRVESEGCMDKSNQYLTLDGIAFTSAAGIGLA
jgi:hypothetical protein